MRMGPLAGEPLSSWAENWAWLGWKLKESPIQSTSEVFWEHLEHIGDVFKNSFLFFKTKTHTKKRHV